jgi:hypothetical protein
LGGSWLRQKRVGKECEPSVSGFDALQMSNLLAEGSLYIQRKLDAEQKIEPAKDGA